MLTIDNIHKTFFPGSVNEKRALQGVSLTLQDGDFATVIGSNGAGKSTLLNAIAGAFYIDQGQIRIDDIDVTRMPEHERAQYIGRVFQDPMKGTASKMMIPSPAITEKNNSFQRSLYIISRIKHLHGLQICLHLSVIF